MYYLNNDFVFHTSVFDFVQVFEFIGLFGSNVMDVHRYIIEWKEYNRSNSNQFKKPVRKHFTKIW